MFATQARYWITAEKYTRILTYKSLIYVGLGLLIYYGVREVLPAAKARHFQETSCFVNYSAFDGEEVCDCGAGFPLSSCYPCLKIHVEFAQKLPRTIGTGLPAECNVCYTG